MNQPTKTATGEWTYSEYARLPDDGNRYEVLDGEVLVTPAPTMHHQKVVQRLLLALVRYVEDAGHGWVFQDVDLLFATGHFLRPDLLVVPADAREGMTDRGMELPPALVVEVLSPSTRAVDMEKKPRRYLDFGVPGYWVVDPGKRLFGSGIRTRGPTSPGRSGTPSGGAFPKGSSPSRSRSGSWWRPCKGATDRLTQNPSTSPRRRGSVTPWRSPDSWSRQMICMEPVRHV
jgi:Uma2 family endonuclease